MLAAFGLVLTTILGSLAAYCAFALSPTEAVRITLLGVVGLGLGLVVGRLGALIALVCFYVGMVVWPSVIHVLCAPEGCSATPLEAYLMMLGWYFPFAVYGTVMGAIGSLIRLRAWRRVRPTRVRA